ncbi:glucose-6-phosphate isomerase [Hyphobacterium marinum]|uniref:Glucose-6-phosphate isomerase n=1 Tax=Hyphobacterium marinum TaxID=3116574 RepID=A0ABU7LWS9_9PROT|nr:glucose-6-phosphate isomerase [Hyphobacterium sp. Y6023]MEE2565936.1 glucose-6-phosphate isomerase [Hyphobacterium sp. Y6023]
MDSSREQAFDALQRLAADEGSRDARAFFSEETDRVAAFTVRAAGLTADFSKQAVSSTARDRLVDAARASGLADAMTALAGGQPINVTEKRAASHMALRGTGGDVAGIRAAEAELSRVFDFAAAIRSGAHTGATGKPIRTILHIGIGGSDLGPRLVYKALMTGRDGPQIRFLASPDPGTLSRVTRELDPEETLVFIVSKSFGTAETRANALAAKAWLEAGLGGRDPAPHLAAASASPGAAAEFGVPREAVFDMWDWVGGRYSLWSSVSFSVICALGPDRFRELLAGAAELDRHFLEASWDRNLPVLMGLVAYWNRACLNRASQAVVPYAAPLALLPAWLQQLSMESLGKRVTPSGAPVPGETGAVIWGAEGPNGQHAFFQLLHQGTSIIPADLIAVIGRDGPEAHNRMMLANALAQAEALLKGRTAAEARDELLAKGTGEDEADRLAPHLEMPGGRPTSFIALDRLDAHCVGALLALYEHAVFVQSVLYRVNAFDQYGVELGKTLASALETELETGATGAHDPSTQAWLDRLRKQSR